MVATLVYAFTAAPRLTVALGLTLTVALGVVVLDRATINTDATDMLSAKLAFRTDFEAFKRAFPMLTDNLVVVIDGADPDRVEDAADRLYRRLAGDQLFKDVFYPEADPFFRRNGLLYLSCMELVASQNFYRWPPGS